MLKSVTLSKIYTLIIWYNYATFFNSDQNVQLEQLIKEDPPLEELSVKTTLQAASGNLCFIFVCLMFLHYLLPS